MSVAPLPHQHPVLACAAGIDALLDDVKGVDPTYMRTSEKEEALRALARVSARLDSVRLSLMAASGDVAADEGARDVAAWLGTHVNADRGETRRELRLAGFPEGKGRRNKFLVTPLDSSGALWNL